MARLCAIVRNNNGNITNKYNYNYRCLYFVSKIIFVIIAIISDISRYLVFGHGRICRKVTDEFFFGELMNHFTLFHHDALFGIFQKRFNEKTTMFPDIWTRYEVLTLQKKKKKKLNNNNIYQCKYNTDDIYIRIQFAKHDRS